MIQVDALAVCYSLLSKESPDRQKSLLASAHPAIADVFQRWGQASFFFEGNPCIEPDARLRIHQVHYSWMRAVFKKIPFEDQELYASCLSLEQQQGLLGKESSLYGHCSFLLDQFLAKWWVAQIIPSNIFPRELLIKSALNALLHHSPTELGMVVKALGMYDLVGELSKIVDKELLNAIYAALDDVQVRFLRSLFFLKNTLSFQRLDLAQWNGDLRVLQHVLGIRGVNRLAKACFGSDDSLLWHLSRALSQQEGELFLKLCQPLSVVVAQSSLIEQVFVVSQWIRNLQ